MRQGDPVLRSYAVTHPRGAVALPTQTGWDQVVYADRGVVHVQTPDDTWTVPAHRALCAPNGARLRVFTARRTALRCVYAHVDVGLLRDELRVIDVSALTRELLLHVVTIAPLRLDSTVEAAVVTLLRSQLDAAPTSSLRLPLPTDDRGRQLVDRILADPAASLTDAITGTGASRRTLERILVAETGLTPAAWQRRARVLAAISLLADQSVTRTAADVGYATPSAFVAAFRSELGATPRAFVNR